jgi:hypothetical protein
MSPRPKDGESKKDFVARCIPIVMNEKEGTTEEQATGKCFGMYESAKKSEMIKLIKGIKGSLEKLAEKAELMEIFENEKEDVMKARTVDGFESPEPGDIPEKGKQLLAETYAKCRKDGGEKEKCSKIAWGAVNRAGLDKAEKADNLNALEILTKMHDVLKKMIEERY